MRTNEIPLVLVAEDDPDDQYFFQEALAAASPPDVEAHYLIDGDQLMRLLREKMQQGCMPRLVVLDLHMLVCDGRATLRKLKSDPATAGIPVVILTTSDDADDMEFCKSQGAAAFFRKPSSIMALVELVRALKRDYLQ